MFFLSLPPTPVFFFLVALIYSWFFSYPRNDIVVEHRRLLNLSCLLFFISLRAQKNRMGRKVHGRVSFDYDYSSKYVYKYDLGRLKLRGKATKGGVISINIETHPRAMIDGSLKFNILFKESNLGLFGFLLVIFLLFLFADCLSLVSKFKRPFDMIFSLIVLFFSRAFNVIPFYV